MTAKENSRKNSRKNSIVRQFLEATALEQCAQPLAADGREPPPAEKPVPDGAEKILLPEPGLLPDRNVNFLELVELRSTVRQYTKEKISLQDLSYLLWCTQGVKMALPNGSSRRTVPSAGGRHAFETYLYLQKVEGLEKGLYRFLPMEHALVRETAQEKAESSFLAGFKAMNMVAESAATFVWAAVLERMAYKFGSRACRYLFLDAGHVCENLYLAAQTIQLGVCAIGAFYDDKLNQALGLDGETEFAVYGATVGRI